MIGQLIEKVIGKGVDGNDNGGEGNNFFFFLKRNRKNKRGLVTKEK